MGILYGRERELEWLEQLLDKRTASFVVVYGRRRIGKSTQITSFCDTYFFTDILRVYGTIT